MTKVTISGQGRVVVGIPDTQPFEIISVLEFVMSKCTTKVALRGIFVTLLAIGMQATFVIGATTVSGFGTATPDQPRMATFENAGETHFALSIMPQVTSKVQLPSDVVVYVDTSASQGGVFKRDSIEALKDLVRNLSADDRIQIVAVDLDPVPLTTGFVSPMSDDVKVAIQNLDARVSLGTTDMEAMLNAATKSFADTTGRNKNVIYIGDGISRGSILHSDLFGTLVRGLTENHIAVSSFAIGPERNIELMAALANNTGGNLYVDTDKEDSIRLSAVALAETVHGSVFWQKDGKLDDSIVTIYPNRFPPLRTDRDTIVLGTLADREPIELVMSGLMDGQPLEMEWMITPEASNIDFGFLPGMIRTAQKDGGLSLPTLGSVGLAEFARARTVESARLTELGGQALVMGNRDAARKLATAALSADPANTTADMLSMASTYKVQDNDDPFAEPPTQDPAGDDPFGEPAAQDPAGDDPFGDAPATDAPVADAPVADAPATEAPMEDETVADEPADDFVLPVEPGQEQVGQDAIALPMDSADGGITLLGEPEGGDEVGRLLNGLSDRSDNILLSEDERIKVINEKIRQQVQYEQTRGREELRENPDIAIERLKNILEAVEQIPELYPSTRAELRHTIESSLLSFRQRKLEYDDARELRDIAVANAAGIVETATRQARDEEQISILVNKFNSLVEEKNYNDAFDVTRRAVELDQNDPAVVVASENARASRNYYKLLELRRLKQESFAEMMYETEKISIPFPAVEPLIFPNADVWKAKRLRRKKYEQIRLTGSKKDEQILEALESDAFFDYDETPWVDIEEELEKKYGINIVLDESAADDALPEDEPVTMKLTGIRLKNALRILLKQKNATFVVKDEVLNIISIDEAEDAKWFVTNVYNVGDLVAPRSAPPVGMGGQGGGQGGGGFGGGQGGGGFGGGGGGQQGGGGGAGLFCIQESSVSLNLGNTPVAKPAGRKPKVIVVDSSISPDLAWSNYFSENFADPADVRRTARNLIRNNKSDEIVSMIHGAIRHQQIQPWMYEGLVLAMQVAGRPQSEIERALLSTVDLSTDDNDSLYAANYMAENGMEKRAISLLKSYARSNPTRNEPFVVGLRAAQRINDIEGIKWASIGIASQEWPDHPEIVKEAKYAAIAVKNALQKAGRSDELAAFDADLKRAQERDCLIRVTWTGDADLDLHVMEPGGTVCSRLIKRTSSGGVSMGDKFSRKSGLSGEVSETYVLPKGFSGDYRLIIKRMWGEVTSGKVSVSIHNHYRSDKEASLTKQVKIDDKGAMVLFALNNGRRTEPLDDHEIQTVVQNQQVSRAVLAQQLGDNFSGSSANDFAGGLIGGGNGLLGLNNQAGLAGLGVVGYQPIIQSFFEGTNMTVNHATTADRLFVMISVTPNFTQITEVTTFNILGDAATAQGAAQSGGQQGGGGQGGGQGGNQGGGGGGGGVF
ncbi:MAG: VWA domain-containing protein [Mariniblastus sp.]